MRHVSIAIITVLFGCLPMAAIAQIPDDHQKCLNSISSFTNKLFKAQSKVTKGCLKHAFRGSLPAETPTADECVVADPKDKIWDFLLFTAIDEMENIVVCEGFLSGLGPPGFGIGTSISHASSPVDFQLRVLSDVFGSQLDGVLIPSAVDPAAAKCQKLVHKTAEKAMMKLVKTYDGKCKKKGLKAGTISSEVDLTACLDAIGAGAGKQVEKLQKILSKKCDPDGLDDLFPGVCGSAGDSAAIGACLGREAACHACQYRKGTDDLSAGDCDTVDDGIVNASCPDYVAPVIRMHDLGVFLGSEIGDRASIDALCQANKPEDCNESFGFLSYLGDNLGDKAEEKGFPKYRPVAWEDGDVVIGLGWEMFFRWVVSSNSPNHGFPELSSASDLFWSGTEKSGDAIAGADARCTVDDLDPGWNSNSGFGWTGDRDYAGFTFAFDWPNNVQQSCSTQASVLCACY